MTKNALYLCSERRAGERGFTLVELMVVITLIALMSTIVVLTVPDPRARVVDDAQRFAARAAIVRDLAVVEARPTSLWVSAEGYGFERRRGGVWQSIEDRGLAPVRWREGNAPLIAGAGRERVVFDSLGLPDKPLALRLVGNGQRVSIVIEGDGKAHVGG